MSLSALSVLWGHKFFCWSQSLLSLGKGRVDPGQVTSPSQGSYIINYLYRHAKYSTTVQIHSLVEEHSTLAVRWVFYGFLAVLGKSWCQSLLQVGSGSKIKAEMWYDWQSSIHTTRYQGGVPE